MLNESRNEMIYERNHNYIELWISNQLFEAVILAFITARIIASLAFISTVQYMIQYIYIYSLRHRKCGVRGFMHELFLSKTRTSEERASEGF